MCFGRLLARTGEDHLLESKKPMCLRPENEIAAVTFFAKNVAAATISNTFASVTEWQDSREHGCWRSLARSACCQSLPKRHVVWNCLGVVVADFPQHGVGEVLIPLRHCWRMLFSVFALAVDRFVTIGRRTAQFCFGLLMRCFFLGSGLCRSQDEEQASRPVQEHLIPTRSRATETRWHRTWTRI